jgi:hypothetical protein
VVRQQLSPYDPRNEQVQRKACQAEPKPQQPGAREVDAVDESEYQHREPRTKSLSPRRPTAYWPAQKAQQPPSEHDCNRGASEVDQHEPPGSSQFQNTPDFDRQAHIRVARTHDGQKTTDPSTVNRQTSRTMGPTARTRGVMTPEATAWAIRL